MLEAAGSPQRPEPQNCCHYEIWLYEIRIVDNRGVCKIATTNLFPCHARPSYDQG